MGQFTLVTGQYCCKRGCSLRCWKCTDGVWEGRHAVKGWGLAWAGCTGQGAGGLQAGYRLENGCLYLFLATRSN